MCDKAALLKFLCPKKTVKEVMVDAEFNDKDIGIDLYSKRIKMKLKVLKTRHGSTLPSRLTRTTTKTVTITKSTSSRKTSKQVVKENAVKSIEKLEFDNDDDNGEEYVVMKLTGLGGAGRVNLCLVFNTLAFFRSSFCINQTNL